eukprot:scaffold8436_cov27-Phaeocystis_antarctica.AAC.2
MPSRRAYRRYAATAHSTHLRSILGELHADRSRGAPTLPTLDVLSDKFVLIVLIEKGNLNGETTKFHQTSFTKLPRARYTQRQQSYIIKDCGRGGKEGIYPKPGHPHCENKQPEFILYRKCRSHKSQVHASSGNRHGDGARALTRASHRTPAGTRTWLELGLGVLSCLNQPSPNQALT